MIAVSQNDHLDGPFTHALVSSKRPNARPRSSAIGVGTDGDYSRATFVLSLLPSDDPITARN